jgi:hypothetical protein
MPKKGKSSTGRSAKAGGLTQKRRRTIQEKAADLDKRVEGRLAAVEASEGKALGELKKLAQSWGEESETALRKAAKAVLTDFRVSEHLDRSFAELRPSMAAAQASVLRLLSSKKPNEQNRGLRALNNLNNQMLRRREQDVHLVRAALQASAMATYEQFRATLDEAQGASTTVEQLNRELWREQGRPADLPGSAPAEPGGAVETQSG